MQCVVLQDDHLFSLIILRYVCCVRNKNFGKEIVPTFPSNSGILVLLLQGGRRKLYKDFGAKTGGLDGRTKCAARGEWQSPALVFQRMDIDIRCPESECTSVGTALARNEQTRQGGAMGAHPCVCQCTRK